MIKAVCFDLDGTLVNSERLYVQANVKAAQQLGYRLQTSDFLPLVGISDDAFQTALDCLIKPAQQTQFIQLTQKLVDQRIAQATSLAQPGANLCLQHLKARGVTLAIVTTSAADYTKRMLQNTGWSKMFAVVITGVAGAAKPAPDLYLEALKQLQLTPPQVLAVEDSPVGVQAAVAAGIQCVQVQDLAPQSDLADAQVENLIELKKMFCA
ncbi:HAD family hydrolase [Lacticaseibacillus porcinae]|uniref:HAD family hydrolase n=1 Tax=Lacticaseibacillus porcinae TaxID=1123687 RepID=UPI000F78D494|nr:HAD family phosphatase [Lacticaseibacillus porcinae]